MKKLILITALVCLTTAASAEIRSYYCGDGNKHQTLTLNLDKGVISFGKKEYSNLHEPDDCDAKICYAFSGGRLNVATQGIGTLEFENGETYDCNHVKTLYDISEVESGVYSEPSHPHEQWDIKPIKDEKGNIIKGRLEVNINEQICTFSTIKVVKDNKFLVSAVCGDEGKDKGNVTFEILKGYTVRFGLPGSKVLITARYEMPIPDHN